MDQSRESIHQKLYTMTLMKGEELEISYSDIGKLKVVEEMVKIAGAYNKLYRKYNDLIIERKRLQEKEGGLAGHLKRVQGERKVVQAALAQYLSSLQSTTARIEALFAQVFRLENAQRSQQQTLSEIDSTSYVTYRSNRGTWEVLETYLPKNEQESSASARLMEEKPSTNPAIIEKRQNLLDPDKTEGFYKAASEGELEKIHSYLEGEFPIEGVEGICALDFAVGSQRGQWKEVVALLLTIGVPPSTFGMLHGLAKAVQRKNQDLICAFLDWGVELNLTEEKASN